MALARIGRFVVERRLGSGSFASVWLARDEDLEAWVAIKVLADNWSFNEDARRRFLEEARALRYLDNDRIVRVYEVGRLGDDRPFMVMEYADRGTLEDRIRLRRELGRPFGVREALETSIEIADCLTSVHASRIVHRDVKPSNVLYRGLSREAQEALRRNGLPVPAERTLLGDFGIARRLEGMLGHTLVLGSPHYMAPEQADPDRARHADQRSDVYSAAVVLYELLAGRLPYRFDSLADLQQADDLGPPPSLEGVRSDVPPHVALAVHRGLAREPGRRFASAWEWRDALRSALEAMSEAPADVAVRASVATATAAGRIGSSGTTAPAATRAGTLRERDAPEASWGLQQPARRPATVAREEASRTVPRRPSITLAAAGVLLASVTALVGVFLPWDAEARGTAFGQSATVAAGAALLFLAGLRMSRTRRRWMAIVASSVALGLGVVGLFLAPVTMLVVGGGGSGLVLILASAALALLSAYRGLMTLRRDPRPWARPSSG